jgi:prepilin-type N-terminal cleavage/methylation domain-containing protein
MSHRCTRGLTLLELLVAMSIMAMVVVSLGTLANGVQQGFDYTEGHSTATQHARVALERIARSVREAQANEQFPGALVVPEKVGTWSFPDVLVVWHPAGTAANPEGLPLVRELLIYCPSLSTPNRLVEITMSSDAQPVPAVSQTAQWAALIGVIRRSPQRKEVTLTELMRTAALNLSSGELPRGAVRFVVRLTPSEAQWAAYRSGGPPTWDNLAWVQGIYGSQTGLRQTWLRIELQLLPGKAALTRDTTGQSAIPFLGSAALYYELHR